LALIRTPNSKRDLFMRIPGGVFKGGGKIKDEAAKNRILRSSRH
jgi:hypothetical protein